MVEQDYIMRLIKEMIRTLLKLLFHIDIESPTSELVTDIEMKTALDDLLGMIDTGRINEAENKLYSITDGSDTRTLKVALLFYSYLNDKDDDFLKDSGFSREEIHMGIKDTVSRYGLNGISEIFLSDL